MDMQAVFEFLLDLHDLSLLFVSLMALTFLFGWFYARRCINSFKQSLKELKQEYKDSPFGYASRLDPKSYIELNIDEQHSKGFVDSIPGTLVSLGILGTFIGLGIAVGEASSAMTGDFNSTEGIEQVQYALNKMMNSISSKFTASAWGILLSIIFSFTVKRSFEEQLEVMIEDSAIELLDAYRSPAHVMKESMEKLGKQLKTGLFEGLEKSFQNLEQILQENGEQAKANAEKNAKDMAGLFQSLQKEISIPLGELARQFQQVQKSLLVLSKSIKTVSSSAQKMENAAQNLGDLSEKVDRSLENVSKTIGDKLEASQGAAKKFAEKQQTSLQKSLSNMGESLQTAQKQQLDTSKAMSESLKESLLDMKEGLKSSSKEMTLSLSNSLKEMRIDQGKTSQQMTDTLQAMLQDMKEGLNSSSKEMTLSLSNSLKEMRIDQSKTSQQMTTSLQESLNKMKQELKSSTKAQIEAAKKMSTDLGKTIQSMEKTIQRLREDIESTLQESNTIQRKSSSLQEDMKRIMSELSGVNEELTKANKKANDLNGDMMEVLTKFQSVLAQKQLESDFHNFENPDREYPTLEEDEEYGDDDDSLGI